MNGTNPVTGEVKKVAVENVAEGTISKKEMDSMERALSMGAKMVIKTLEIEGVKLTKEQEEKVCQAYQASFAITALLMK